MRRRYSGSPRRHWLKTIFLDSFLLSCIADEGVQVWSLLYKIQQSCAAVRLSLLYALLQVGQSGILFTIPFVTTQSVQRCLRQELHVLSCSVQTVPPQTSHIALDFSSQIEHF